MRIQNILIFCNPCNDSTLRGRIEPPQWGFHYCVEKRIEICCTTSDDEYIKNFILYIANDGRKTSDGNIYSKIAI